MYLYYHPLGKEGQNNKPTSISSINGQLEFTGSSSPVYAMCEGTATTGTNSDGVSYCYISNSHCGDGGSYYFQYLYGDFSVENGVQVQKGQQIGTTSDKGATGSDKIAINLTTNTDSGEAVSGALDSSANTWNGKEIDESIVIADAQAFATAAGFDDSNMAYNYLIFAGPLKIMSTTSNASGDEGEWITDNLPDGLNAIYTHNGHTFKVFNQGRGSWAGVRVEAGGGGPISSSGCSCCSCACITSGWDSDITPDVFARKGLGPSRGMDKFLQYTSPYGISGKVVGYSASMKQQIIDHLNLGFFILANVNGNYGPRATNAGHYTCLLNYRASDDKIFNADSASKPCTGWNSLDAMCRGISVSNSHSCVFFNP